MEALYGCLSSLMDVKVAEVTDGTLNDVATRYDALRRIQAMTKDLLDAVTLQLIDSMPEDTMEFPSVGTIRRYEKRSKRVGSGGTAKLHRDLTVAVARVIGTDLFTGEINHLRREAAVDAVKLVVSTCSLSATALKQNARDEIGLEPDDYVTVVKTYAIDVEVDDEAL